MGMILKEHVNRISKADPKKIFKRYLISVSPELVKELGWKKGQNLKASVRNSKLVVEKE